MLYPLSYGGSVISPAVFSLNRRRACHRVEGFVILKPGQNPSMASVGPPAATVLLQVQLVAQPLLRRPPSRKSRPRSERNYSASNFRVALRFDLTGWM
jgi:hypothetical protein